MNQTRLNIEKAAFCGTQDRDISVCLRECSKYCNFLFLYDIEHILHLLECLH